MNKYHKIGRFDLVLPADHRLDIYQSRYRLYDRGLGEIANAVISKYPDMTAIDIGANVGDSAALICSKHDVPVLCIEGNPRFTSYLRANLDKLHPAVVLAECLVGAQNGFVAAQDLRTGGGTASLVHATSPVSSDARIVVRTLQDILAEYPAFAGAKLIKIDTDGGDFEILIASAHLFCQSRPVLYFEYDPTFRKTGLQQAMNAVTRLQEVGYRRFLCYDNFGHFAREIADDVTAQFLDLNRYVMSHLFFGRQIYYFDICAVCESERDIADKLVTFHRNAMDECIARQGWLLPEKN